MTASRCPLFFTHLKPKTINITTNLKQSINQFPLTSLSQSRSDPVVFV